MTWHARLYQALENGNQLVIAALASEMATVLDAASAPVAPAAADEQPSEQPSHAARQARYRAKRDASRVTKSVTLSVTRDAKSVTPSVTSVTQASRGASRDASRVTPSRAVVQDLTAVASAVGSESSLTAAAAVLELPRTTNGQTGVTRDASLSVTSASPSVTRDASQASPGVTPSVTRDAAAMELQKVLGPVISRKFRDLLLRHELNKDAAAMWIVTVSDKLKDKRYVPEDAGQMCDDDIANPIQQGLKGVLAFMDRARLNRVVAEQEHMKSMAGLIDTRRAKDPAWWDWCVESAKQAGFANGYVFAAPHFHDPWPVEESNGQ